MPPDQSASDLVVVVIGPSGAGKSTFIRNILSSSGLTHRGSCLPEVNDASMEPCTKKALPYFGEVASSHWLTEFGIKRVILVDTPCGEETVMGPLSAVALLSAPSTKMALIVYVFAATTGRMTRSCLDFLKDLEGLWDSNTAKNMAIVTTHWSAYSASPDLASNREAELTQKILKPIMGKGACHYQAGDDSPEGSSSLLQRILTEQIQRNPPPDVEALRRQIIRKLQLDRQLRKAYDNLLKDISKDSQEFNPGEDIYRHKWLVMFEEILKRLMPGR